MAVGADQQGHREHGLLGLSVGTLDLAREQQVEGLVGAPELDVGVDHHRVVALQQRVEQLEHRDRARGGHPLGEVVALEQLRDGGHAYEREQLAHRHVQPLAVAPQLQAGRIGIEDAKCLLLVGAGVVFDLLVVEHGAGGRAARGVADARGVVADDQHDPVAEVLELAQLAQHHRVAEVDVRRGGVDAELDAQRPPGFAGGRELLRESSLGKARDGVAGEVRRLLGVGHTHVRHRGPMLGLSSRRLGPSRAVLGAAGAPSFRRTARRAEGVFDASMSDDDQLPYSFNRQVSRRTTEPQRAARPRTGTGTTGRL